MSLEDWLTEGHLKSHRTSRDELRQLFAVYERDMSDAGVAGLSIERQFESAYNAALMMARVALAAGGYRTSGEANHYWTILSLEFTLGLDAGTINTFNAFRRKRNISNYEMIGMVSAREVVEMITLAEKLHSRVREWLKNTYPELFPE